MPQQDHEQGSKRAVTRRQFLKQSATAAALPAQSVAPGRAGSLDASKQPNIVMVIADQFRWDAVGAAGAGPIRVNNRVSRVGRGEVKAEKERIVRAQLAPADIDETAIKNAVPAAQDDLGPQPIGKSEARSEVGLLGGAQAWKRRVPELDSVLGQLGQEIRGKGKRSFGNPRERRRC